MLAERQGGEQADVRGPGGDAGRGVRGLVVCARQQEQPQHHHEQIDVGLDPALGARKVDQRRAPVADPAVAAAASCARRGGPGAGAVSAAMTVKGRLYFPYRKTFNSSPRRSVGPPWCSWKLPRCTIHARTSATKPLASAPFAVCQEERPGCGRWCQQQSGSVLLAPIRTGSSVLRSNAKRTSAMSRKCASCSGRGASFPASSVVTSATPHQPGLVRATLVRAARRRSHVRVRTTDLPAPCRCTAVPPAWPSLSRTGA